jgi:1,4-alpha-glucan branching enzyme
VCLVTVFCEGELMDSTKTERSKPSPATIRGVAFIVRAKGASEVVLTGDFTQWTQEGIRLRKGASDEWRAVLSLEPGEYQYLLVIDGHWQEDPQASKRVPNPYGGFNSVIQVPARGDR